MLNTTVLSAMSKSASKRKKKEDGKAEEGRSEGAEEKEQGYPEGEPDTTVRASDATNKASAEKVLKRRPSRIERSLSTVGELYNNFLLPSTVSRFSTVQDRKVEFEAGPLRQLFMVLDDPQCCGLAKCVSIFMMAVIVLSCVIYVISTDASLRDTPSTCDQPVCDNDPDLCPGKVLCEPVPPKVFDTIEMYCIVLFTMDYGLRVLLVMFIPPRIAGVLTVEEEELALTTALLASRGDQEGMEEVVVASREELERARAQCEDPPLLPPLVLWRYMTQLMNIIDVVAIVPFYIELATSSGSSIAIVRVLRLARMLRIFKASKYNEGTKLLSQTIWRSLPALSLLFFFTALGVVLFGSLIYFMEGGKYEVTADFPDGAYLRSDLVGGSEVTPYTSIPVACYWVIVTATTVGFGDLYPTSGGGRLVACICMYIGLLVLALPITVVGSNFTMVYEEKQELEDEKERLLALRDGGASSEGERERQGSITSLAELGLQGVALTDQTLNLQGAAPMATTPSRRNSGRSPSSQTLELMKQQLLVQQAHMRHLHDMRSKAEETAVGASSSPASALRKRCRKIKVNGTGRVRMRRKNMGGSFDDNEVCSEMSGETMNTEESQSTIEPGRRAKALSLDTSQSVFAGIGISPQAQPDLMLSPPSGEGGGDGGADVQKSRDALQSALRLSEQLDTLISQLQRQEAVIAMQQRQLQKKDAQLAAATGGTTRPAQISSSSSTQEQRGSIKLQVNIEKANSSATSSFLAEHRQNPSGEHKESCVDA
mmetsp:Transcript_28470/g.48129  ORF Transcript_28470/g.48129 Transcript_28470/m.48129 type:complete len:769 (+) Transcript_28470:182-2488(+)